MKKIIWTTLLIGGLMACDSKPKVIVSDDSATEEQQLMSDESASKLHKVVVDEILYTTKYSFLNVSEEGKTFWIAIPRKDVEKGETYYYRGGLKKTNFKSIEHDRVFETIYLVSDVSKDPGMAGMSGGNPHENPGNTVSTDQNTKIEPPPGGITIAELMTNKKKYEGQIVKVKGRVVKLNNMIMNRNWVHLQDGSMADDNIDLTVTTTDNIALGAIAAFEGKITLNKDFGAGYKYDIIMEDARLLP